MARYFKCIVCLLVVFGLLSGCKDAPIDNSQSEPSRLNYVVRIQSELNAAIKDVKVFVYEDAAQKELVCVDQTDENGQISFLAPKSDRYIAVLKDVPVGYATEEYYSLSEPNAFISLSSRELTSEEMEQVQYVLGDKMLDFSVTDCEGKRYSLSELLNRKKAVVLNFWYQNCGPCKMEFPYLQEAYEQYGQDVEFLALNPVDGSADEILSFKSEHHLTFPMGQCDPNWQTLMKISAYPTTVILDREGTICVIHEGMFTDSQELCNAIEYFTAEDYSTSTFGSIEQIPR